MHITRPLLIKEYVSAMHRGVAALFVGAGMSRPAGFVDWKRLLHDCAVQLNLDVEKEQDLVAVAQYYINARNRVEIDRIIRDEFQSPETQETINHQIIARLPITTIWTTNFDKLLETALAKEGRNVGVKTSDKDLSYSSKSRDVTLYKMHGDVNNPSEAVISKDDYERYSKKHPLFQNQLTVDLIDKTFLFLGFSFSDPNLNYILGHLRTMIEGSGRKHFAILREARCDLHLKNKKTAYQQGAYERNKQELQVQDLMRYNIETFFIKDFREVTGLLYCINRHYYFKNIFVSGSAHEFGPFGEDRMSDFCMHLGEKIIAKNFKLITGMGLNIGNSILKGAILKVNDKKAKIDDCISMRPFPRNLPDNIDERAYNEKYRSDIISTSGIIIFIAGTSRTSHISKGVMQEYRISREMGKILIPIGVTGFAAQRIWETMRPDIKKIYNNAVTEKVYNKLNRADIGDNELIDTVFEIIDAVVSSCEVSCLGPTKEDVLHNSPKCPFVFQEAEKPIRL